MWQILYGYIYQSFALMACRGSSSNHHKQALTSSLCVVLTGAGQEESRCLCLLLSRCCGCVSYEQQCLKQQLNRSFQLHQGLLTLVSHSAQSNWTRSVFVNGAVTQELSVLVTSSPPSHDNPSGLCSSFSPTNRRQCRRL